MLTENINKEFLTHFQSKVIQARKLLQMGNHRWGDQILTNLYYDIEKIDWLDSQKKQQLVMVEMNSWWMYINSLKFKIGKGSSLDIVRYIDAYKRFFSFLSMLDDYYQFKVFWTRLLKEFIQRENLSNEGILKFVNSVCFRAKTEEDFQTLIELQILLAYLIQTVVPSELFKYSMKIFSNLLQELEPSKRGLFVYIIIENVKIKYQLTGSSEEFVNSIYKLLINRLSEYLKTEFSRASRFSINERNYKAILRGMDELVTEINNIGKHDWTIAVIRNTFSKINEFETFGDAINYIHKYIELSRDQSYFNVTYEIYDFLDDLLLYDSDLSYDYVLVELWAEACKKFEGVKENKFLFQSLQKLNNHLKFPQNNEEIFHYFYTCNYLWKFKSRFFSLEDMDFWRMIFYRILFEEKDFILAKKLIPLLDENLAPFLENLEVLYTSTEPNRNKIYSFEDEFNISLEYDPSFIISQIVVRVTNTGSIQYYLISTENNLIYGTVNDEYWNDSQLNKLFYGVFIGNNEKNFTTEDFGKIFYAFLPEILRRYMSQFRLLKSTVRPQIYFMFDQKLSIPMEILYDDSFFMLRYSIGYKVGDFLLSDSLMGIFPKEFESEVNQKKPNTLLIDCLNSEFPLKWNDSLQKKEILYEFSEGKDVLSYFLNFFSNKNHINEMTSLSDMESIYNTIIEKLSLGTFDMIHFVGNILYTQTNPQGSYIITNDCKILKIKQISDIIQKSYRERSPIVFFDCQVFDPDGHRHRFPLEAYSNIYKVFNNNKRILGVIARIIPVFNNESRFLSASFYVNVINSWNLGNSLLNARRRLIQKKFKIESSKSFDITQFEQKLQLNDLIELNSLILFGEPWKKMILP